MTFDPSVFGAEDGETLDVSLSYTVDDGSGAPNAQASGVVALSVTGIDEDNTQPVATDASIDQLVGTGNIVVDFAPYVSDGDGDLLTITAANLDIGGTIYTSTIFSGTQALFDISAETLGEDYNAVGALTYTVDDGTGAPNATDDGVITLNLTGNAAPVIAPLSVDYDTDVDTGNIVIDLNGIVSDPNPGDTVLTLTLGSFTTGGEEGLDTGGVHRNQSRRSQHRSGAVRPGGRSIRFRPASVQRGRWQRGLQQQHPGSVDLTVVNPASQITLNFDEFDDGVVGDYIISVAGSQGFGFSDNAVVIETDDPGATGGRGTYFAYSNGAVSDGNVLTTDDGEALTIYSPGTVDPADGGQEFGDLVDFESAYLTGAWNNGMTVTVTALVEGVIEVDDGFGGTFFQPALVAAGSETFTVNASGPLFVEFDDAIFDEALAIQFETSGGTNAGLGGFGDQLILDDVLIFV